MRFSLYGEIIQYLKKIDQKTDGHRIRNIDFIYIINLDQRPEKFAICKEQLEYFNICPFRFSAVNGWELPLEVINKLGVKFTPGVEGNHWGTFYPLDNRGEPYSEVMHRYGQNYFCHTMSRGAIGIVLSHLSILKDAYDSGYETIWVMEDDIQISQDPHLLSDLIDKLDVITLKEWDILFTDPDTKNQKGIYIPCKSYAWRPNFRPKNPEIFQMRLNISPEFCRIGARYGAYSMILRRSGIKKLLDFFQKYQIFLPYDMEYSLPEEMKLFSVKQDVISTLCNALSDNGAPNYLNKR